MKKIKLNQDTAITYFTKIKNRKRFLVLTLGEFFSAVQTGTEKFSTSKDNIKKLAQKCRKLSVDARKGFKEKFIPAVQFQCNPNGSINPLMCIDYEATDREVPKESIVMRGVSISGQGEFIIIRLPDAASSSEQAYNEHAKAAQDYLDIPSQKGQASLDRVRYLSYDPNITVNYAAIPLVIPKDFLTIDNSLETLYLNAKSGITQLDNSTGLGVFAHLCCQTDPTEAKKEMELLTYKKDSSIGTAKGREEFYKKWLERYGDKWAKVRVKNVGFIVTEKRILYNEITHGLCAKPTETSYPISITEKSLKELWVKLPQKGRPSYPTFFNTIIGEAPHFNPIEDLFSVPWSGKDQFKLLSKYIVPEHPTFFKDLEKHIIRGINMVLTPPGEDNYHINRYMFVLQSEKFGLGKSTLLRKLTLAGKVPNFSSEFELRDAELKRLMCTIPNLINEEVDGLTVLQLKNFKSEISYSGGQIRITYDKMHSEMRRIATLWATANPRDFLGSVNERWIVHPVISVNFKYTDEVDFIDMWRQCYAAWKKNPLSGELSREEIEVISKKAETHLIFSGLETEIDGLFEPDLTKTNVVCVRDIRIELTISDSDRGIDTAIGRALARLFAPHRAPFTMYKGKRGTFYYLKNNNKWSN